MTAKRGRPRKPLPPGTTPASAEVQRLKALIRYYAGDPKVRWARNALTAARGRAQRYGLAFAITVGDILTIAQDTCPALGMSLDYSRGRVVIQDDSPTVDRIIPPLGYVPGNIVVISNKANMTKGRCTPEEIMAVGRWHGKTLSGLGEMTQW